MYPMTAIPTEQTIVALATPPGTGALGVIRLSGPDAIDIAARIFRGRQDLREAVGYTLHFGRITGADGLVIDEVLASVFRGPRSFTGEDVVEISCHGSPYILGQVIELAITQGCRLAEPGEFTLRAFLHGRMDLTQAEAVADLIASGNREAHRLAMQQMRGGFAANIRALRDELIGFASLIELELDFSEEDVAFADRPQLLGLIARIRGMIGPLLTSFRYGNALKTGIQTVLAGRPNAGKSTLLNALLNEERAIVSDIAGTTRDTIEERFVHEGVEFRLIDTAGIREATDQIEAFGVARTMEKIAQSTVLVYVFDVTELGPADVHGDLERLLRPGLEWLAIANKMDLNPYTEPAAYHHPALLPPDRLITASALNGMNIPYLRDSLLRLVIEQLPGQESAVVTNIRHFEALRETDSSLEAAAAGLESGLPGDLVAMDLRRALYHLGLISGEVTTDDLLSSIFSRFCIGK